MTVSMAVVSWTVLPCTGSVLAPQLCIVTEFAPYGSLSDTLSVPYEASGSFALEGGRHVKIGSGGSSTYSGSRVRTRVLTCRVCYRRL